MHFKIKLMTKTLNMSLSQTSNKLSMMTSFYRSEFSISAIAIVYDLNTSTYGH